MFSVHTEVKSCLVLSSFFLVVLGSKDSNKSDDNAFFYYFKKDTLKDDIETYLKALEEFDTSKYSFVALISAIKKLSVTLDFHKQDEFSAPLFVFPSMRRRVFPDLRYRTNFKAHSDTLIGRIDVIIHRWDGMLFAFTQYNRASAFMSLREAVMIFQRIEKKDKKGRITYRGVRRDISHKILIGLNFVRPATWNSLSLTASCLCDSFDLSRALNLTV